VRGRRSSERRCGCSWVALNASSDGSASGSFGILRRAGDLPLLGALDKQHAERREPHPERSEGSPSVARLQKCWRSFAPLRMTSAQNLRYSNSTMLVGTADINQLASRAPIMESLQGEALVLGQVEVLQVTYEIDAAAREAVL